MDIYEITEYLVHKGEFKNITRKIDILEKFKDFFDKNLKRYIYRDEYEEIKREYIEKFKMFSKNFELREFKRLVNASKNDETAFPKGNHFWYIKNFEITSSEIDQNGMDIVKFQGECNWSLRFALLKSGCYEYYEKFIDRPWFKGTTIEDIIEKYKTIEMEIYSEIENGKCEHLSIKNGKLTYEEDEFEKYCFESVEEAEKAGVTIKEDEVDVEIYKKLPKWTKKDSDSGESSILNWNI